MRDKFDAIVVGAGPAGSSAAMIMAQKGMSVALLERGDYPGSKNVFGGAIYSEPTAEIVPAFWKEAPLERAIVNDQVWLLERESAVKVSFTGLRFAKEPYNKFSVLRSKFDNWLAKKAQEDGAQLFNNTLVKDLVMEKKLIGKGKVNGVKLDTGEVMLADVVILAEGVNAFLTKKAGLRSDIPADTLTLYVKEIIGLPSEKIEERFQLEKGEGSTIGMIGYPGAGAMGKAGIWTNKDTISFNWGVYLNQIVEKGFNTLEMFQRTKEHPLIKRLLAGGETLEYMAHLIPKGGYKFVPKLYTDGLMVAGDAAVMISGRRGSDLAMLSGKMAAEVAVQAKAKSDFSEKTLSSYATKLNNSFFMKDIKGSPDKTKYYKENPDTDYLVSNTANELAYRFFTEDMSTDKEKYKQLMDIVKSKQNPVKTISDIYYGYKYWGLF
ncbi:electron transfer flavoprotein-quinone oxidoreductase [Desulfitispora alkaliphila]|uniref:FAD-dependent oxidoreductase n=1 Tax=Desulfitispora alkaliphila TaxID=622674 RepID=UPI003D1A5F68